MKLSRLFLWLVFLLLSITGVALLWLTPGPDEFPHPLNGVLRELHGLGMMLGLMLLGYMISDHVQKKLTRRHRPWDGYAHLCIWGLVILSGFLLYYPQDFIESLDVSMAQWHGYLGLALIALAPLHATRKLLKRYYYRFRFQRKAKKLINP